MGLPAAVQRQAEMADELVRRLSGEEEPGTPPETVPEEPVEEPVPQQQPATVAQPPAADAANWERRYHVLQGKYDAEVPRLHAEAKEMRLELSRMMAEIAQLKSQPAQKPQAEAPSTITQSDREVFGEDLVDLIERAVKGRTGTLEAENEKLRAQIAKIEGAVVSVADQSEAQLTRAYLADLSRIMPGWEEQNEDPAFIAWLSEIHPSFGVPRQLALKDAFEKRDAQRTKAIFREFKPEAPSTPPPTRNENLARQAAPARTRSAAPSVGNERPMIKQSEITALYDDAIHQRITQEQFEARELQINAAIAENRIIYGQ